MTKSQSSIFRFLLFLAGAGIILLAFSLTKGDRELNKIDAFIWVSIGLMYLFFFLPFFFSTVKIGNFTRKIPSLSMVWLGIILYMAASVGVILALAVANAISINTATIIQAVLLFLFFVNVYFAYFASSHVHDVAAEEAEKQQYIRRIKSKAQTLSLSVNRLPAEYEKTQKTLKKALEDIKYIYPVGGGFGDDLEMQIITTLNTLTELCEDIPSSANPATLEPEADNLLMLIKERKLLRN